MFITHIGIQKHKNHLRLLSSDTKLLFNFLSLKVFLREERETQYFYADCFYIVSSQPNQRAAPVAHKVVCPHPGLNINFFARSQELNSLTFSQIAKILSPRFRCMISFTPPGPISYLGIFILTSVNDASSPRALEHLRSYLH